MSLAQHVSPNEGVDRELEPLIGPECTHVVRRVLSYDLFPPEHVEDQADHIAAYKVSTAKRAGKSTVVDRESEHPTYEVQSKSVSPSLPAGSLRELSLASLL
jgi:hypothetical protein